MKYILSPLLYSRKFLYRTMQWEATLETVAVFSFLELILYYDRVFPGAACPHPSHPLDDLLQAARQSVDLGRCLADGRSSPASQAMCQWAT